LSEFKNSDYLKNGKVNLVFKHFPLNSIHPFAQKAAEATVCSQEQGKFWEMHDAIFENQQALDVNSLKNYAKKIGLNQAKFDSCLDEGKSESKVSNDLKQATSAGGQGTPYFVLVNKKGKTVAVSGAQPWANFEAAIKSLE
jgi:protein-disulfide isomerase